MIMDDDINLDSIINKIKKWPYNDTANLFKYVGYHWKTGSGGYHYSHVVDHITKKYSFYTARDEHNYALIQALKENEIVWEISWNSISRGGYYDFLVIEK